MKIIKKIHHTIRYELLKFFLNQNQFNGYKNNESVSTYYNSGKVEYGTFDVTVNADKYYVIMSNTFSSFSTKTVQLEVAANCR